MKAVVTGVAGFIGSHLAEHLIGLGHDVSGIDCRASGFVPAGMRLHLADICDPDAGRHLKDADCVFHLAAVSTTPAAMRDPARCNDVNVTGTLAMLEAARQAGVPRFVLASSNVVYGAPTPYKVSKLAAEGYAEVFAHLWGLPAVALRFANTFGSLRQGPENCIMALRNSARSRGWTEVTGDGEQSRDFVNVADVVRACVLAAGSDVTGWLDICTGENHTLNEAAAFFGVPVRHVAGRPGDIRHIRQDPGPARDAIGFTAQVPFADGMAAYL